MTTKATRSERQREDDRAATAPSDGPPAPPAVESPPTVPRGSARAASRAVDACAAACIATETRGVLHALARAIRRKSDAINAAIAGGLDEAEAAGPDRWQAAEAAARGLGWAVRGRGIAPDGRHLERLVTLARAACDALGERDTRSARFVIVLARSFADVEACRDFAAAARAAVAEEIARLVTAGGTVALSGSDTCVDRVSRWTGFRDAAAEFGGSAWDDETDRRWSAAARGALRLVGDEGRRLTGGGAGAREPFVDALVRVGRPRTRRTARLVSRGRGRAQRVLATDLHDAAAATTIIRTGWDRDAVRVLLDYRAGAPRLEVAVGDRLLVDGPWEWGVVADGRPLDAEGAWTVSAWESDRKAAYLELAAPLAGGMRLERTVAVLRRHRIVLLADAIVPATTGGPAADALECRAAVTLAPGLDAEPAAETREVLVYDGSMRFLALPLALPEWRTAGRGRLAAADGRLVLEQSGHRRLYAPVWLDCDPRRIGRPLTWRQLTVADTRLNLPPHQAAGFRVQAGRAQWLLYRSLDAPRNRSVLGCNVSSEFLLGRVRRSGEVARTIEIE